MAVTFAGVTLDSPSPYNKKHVVQLSDTVLLSGKHSIQTSTEHALDVSFVCFADSSANITSLLAKVGASGELVVGSDAGRVCYISSLSEIEDPPNYWRYSISFAEETV